MDRSSAIEAATIRAQLEKKGMPIGPYDLLIAGLARSREKNLKELLVCIWKTGLNNVPIATHKVTNHQRPLWRYSNQQKYLSTQSPTPKTSFNCGLKTETYKLISVPQAKPVSSILRRISMLKKYDRKIKKRIGEIQNSINNGQQ